MLEAEMETVNYTGTGRLRVKAVKILRTRLKKSGIEIDAMKREKLAYELLVCQMVIELQNKALRKAATVLRAH